MSASPSRPREWTDPDGRDGRWPLTIGLLVLVAGAAMLAFLRLDPRFFYDDRFSFYNVERLVREGRILPDWFYWYAPVSYLPQGWAARLVNALARATGSLSWAATDAATGELTRFGVRLTRAFGIVYGGFAVVLLAALARRLSGARAGALGALVFATSPWAVYGIAGFKPDPLLLLASVACLLALTEFADEGEARLFWIGALYFGIATAAKLNGALLAVPLAIAALTRDAWPRRLTRLAGGAALAVGVYFALNPFLAETLKYLGRVDMLYQDRGARLDVGVVGMIGVLLELLAQPNFLGRALAVLAAAGLVLVVARCVLRRDAREIRAWSLTLVFVIANLVFLAATSRYPKQNHMLQVLPFVALLAGLALATPLSELARRRPRAATALTAALVALLASRAVVFTGQQTVTPPERELGRELRRALGGGAGRSVGWLVPGGSESQPDLGARGSRLLAVVVDPARRSPEDLALFDCLAGPGPIPEELGSMLRDRFAPASRPLPGVATRWIPGRGGRLWSGCAPWHAAGEPAPLAFAAAGERRWSAVLPAPATPGEAFSLEVRLPIGGDRPPRVALNGNEIAVGLLGGGRRAGLAWSTARSPLSPGRSTLELDAGGAGEPSALLYRWLPPAPGEHSTGEAFEEGGGEAEVDEDAGDVVGGGE